MKTIGERLKCIRGDVSRDKYAPMLGVSKTTIVNYEKGSRCPDANFLTKVLELHQNINPSWLLVGEEPMNKDGSRGEDIDDIIPNRANNLATPHKFTFDELRSNIRRLKLSNNDAVNMGMFMYIMAEIFDYRDNYPEKKFSKLDINDVMLFSFDLCLRGNDNVTELIFSIYNGWKKRKKEIIDSLGNEK